MFNAASIAHHAFGISRNHCHVLTSFLEETEQRSLVQHALTIDSEKLLDIVASHVAGLKTYSGMACG